MNEENVDTRWVDEFYLFVAYKRDEYGSTPIFSKLFDSHTALKFFSAEHSAKNEDKIQGYHSTYYTIKDASIIGEILQKEKEEIDENTSDGYHTFKELYNYRKLYNACLFNEWVKQNKYNVHKSKRHSDGELCFGGGWFVVYAETPYGQISNHYEIKDWNLFKCEERKWAVEWDKHTPEDVARTLVLLAKNI